MSGTAAGGTMAGNLEYYDACWCAGTGCGGHVKLNPAGPGKVVLTYVGCRCAGLYCGGHDLAAGMTPNFTIGAQGAAQHTYTRACDGLHTPGPCPACRVTS